MAIITDYAINFITKKLKNTKILIVCIFYGRTRIGNCQRIEKR